MAEYFVVDAAQAAGGTEPVPLEWKHGENTSKTLERSKAAKFVLMEAASVAEAQEAYRQMYPGNSSSLPACVEKANWKTS